MPGNGTTAKQLKKDASDWESRSQEGIAYMRFIKGNYTICGDQICDEPFV